MAVAREFGGPVTSLAAPDPSEVEEGGRVGAPSAPEEDPPATAITGKGAAVAAAAAATCGGCSCCWCCNAAALWRFSATIGPSQ